jgi:hypothetical protein
LPYPGYSPAIVVKDDRKPRFPRVAALVLDEEVKLGMVGLPYGVRPLGFAAMEKIECFRVDLRAFVSEGEKPWFKSTHQCIDLGVAWRRFT